MNLKKIVLIIINLIDITKGLIKLTHLECVEFDKTFASVHECNFKYVKSGDYYTISIYTKLHQVPVNNVSVNFEFLRKNMVYRPYLYNVHVDFCEVLRNSKRFPFVNTFVLLLATNSNVNHTCPFAHDIIFRNIVLKMEMLRRFPFSNGDFLLNIRVGAYNKWRVNLQFYFTVY